MDAVKSRPIGELLRESGIVSDEMVAYALKVQKVSRERLGDTLRRLRFVTDTEVAQVVARQSRLPYNSLEGVLPAVNALEQVPYNFAQKNFVLPIALKDGRLEVAIDDPFDSERLTRLSRFSTYPVDISVAPRASLGRAIQRAYAFAARSIGEEIEFIARGAQSGQDFSAERLFEQIVASGIDQDASDIHINPTPVATLVSFRIDGVLQLWYSLPPTMHARLVSVCKVRASMDIAEANRPQDGGLSYVFLDTTYDLRVSTIPSTQGENMVLRVLIGSHEMIPLEAIGLGHHQVHLLNQVIRQPFGAILVTGPTGAGKTTTLYSLLRRINAMEMNVMTIEDPVEYQMPLMRQVEVNERAGITFSTAVRAFLRQDPDVILVGEVRDEETASMVVRAAQTGHLVFSSLHTNDAASAVVRLRDLGVEDYMISSSLHCVVAQRLLRKLCPYCRKPDPHPGTWFGVPRSQLFVSVGCPHCRQTGYIGRQAVAEVLIITDDIRQLIDQGKSAYEVMRFAKEHGFIPLDEVARETVHTGVTDVYEYDRVVGHAIAIESVVVDESALEELPPFVSPPPAAPAADLEAQTVLVSTPGAAPAADLEAQTVLVSKPGAAPAADMDAPTVLVSKPQQPAADLDAPTVMVTRPD